jgi:tRNA-dihydrouridine synthase 1
VLLAAARLAQGCCDGVDLNLGCPQRIARRGNYGAFLMDDLPRVQALVQTLSAGLSIPVSCKIRIFPEPSPWPKTVAYARMLEAAGCQLLAVHGRTRDQKDTEAHRADWGAISAVRAALRIPVLANGDVRDVAEAEACMAATGCVGVLSAEPLLRNPALFDSTLSKDRGEAAQARPPEWPALLALQYCELAETHPTPMRMVRGHIHKLLGAWLTEFTDLRDDLNDPKTLSLDSVRGVCERCRERIVAACAGGRREPVAKKGERAVAREALAARAAAVAEQEREERALAALGERKRGREEECEACAA